MTLENYRFALLEQESTLRAFANSFILALAAAIISAVVAVPLAYLSTLRKNPGARVLDLVADAPYAVPGTVLAIAVIIVFLPPVPFIGVSLYGTLGIILVAYLARFLALAVRPTVAGMELVSKNLDEAAQVAGAGVLTAAAGDHPAGGRAVGGGRRAADLHDRVQRADGVGAAVVDRTRDPGRRGVLPALRGQLARGRGGRHHLDRGDAGAGGPGQPHGAQSAGRSGAVAGVTFEAVSKQFGETRAVEGVSLEIADGEFFALLGPSGCGKTTLLRLVAGFEIPDDGIVKLGDAVVGRPGWALPPEKRKIGMVFQSYALWPHMSVAENVAFALRVRRVAEAERVRRVNEALAMVGLDGVAERRPHELSGGQRQRVALARCLAMRPDVVLLDEPLANLDVHLREAMQQEFARFHKEIGATFIYVTHDQAEALALADRVAVMDAGRVEQAASPRLLYAEPASEMVARFVGRGIVVPALVIGRNSERVVVDIWGMRLPVRGAGASGERRSLCLRAENLAITPNGSGIRGRVTGAAYHGAATLVTVQPDARRCAGAEGRARRPAAGERGPR